MGIFKYFADALSGKIYKQNTLVHSNIAKLLEKSQKLPDSKFIKHWAFACILTCDVSLNYLLFEKEGEEINTFKRNMDRLDKKKVFEIIKLLTGHFLSAFKCNKKNVRFLEKANTNIKKLEDDVFSIFSFTRDDEKVFRELNEEYDDNAPKYFLCLYEKIFEKAYEMPSEKDVFSVMLMSGVISNIYTEVFAKSLNDKIENL